MVDEVKAKKIEWNSDEHQEIAISLIKDMSAMLHKTCNLIFEDDMDRIGFYLSIVSNFTVNSVSAVTNFDDKHWEAILLDNITDVIKDILRVSKKHISKIKETNACQMN